MRPAPLLANEHLRLAALLSCNVLDTPPEERFDDLAQLAAQACDVPIALVSLVDAHRQWFKARVGLAATVTTRDVSFCAHALHTPDALFEIRDAREDERFVDNPLVTGDPHIRFYAGVPLTLPSTGLALGTLCVIDRVPRVLTDDQRHTLRVLARHVVALLELRKSVADLERANVALAASQEVALQALRDKSTFVANVSHEIRTPMNSVIGLSELLRHTRLDATQAQYIDIIHASSSALLQVINDILDYSKVEANKLELRPAPFAMRDELPSMLGGLRLAAERKGLAFTVRVDPAVPRVVLLDGVRLGQVLNNLVGNALKFTDTGSIDVHFDLEPGAPASDDVMRLRMSVRDTGIGLSTRDQQAIFEPFAQADDGVHRLGGTGLGLSISAALVKLMGGSFGLVSAPSQGSTFHVVIPVRAVRPAGSQAATSQAATAQATTTQPPTAASSTSTPPRPARALRVLLVDDHQPNQVVGRRMLEHLGHIVTVVDNGRAAVSIVGNTPFDLVFMDVQMPDMDGLDATRAIRDAESRSGRHVPVVGVTAHAMKEEVERCLRAGMDAHVAKPLRLSMLTEVIARFAPEGVPLQG
jgi:signal transduction histidine kinase/ActR/RegA family two-component response regulator